MADPKELVPAPAVHVPPPPPPFPVRAWALPLLRFDQAWARFEVKLATAVLLAEIVALIAWVVLRGLSTEYQASSGNRSGLILRAVLAAVVLGSLTYGVIAKRWPERRRVLTTTCVVLGSLLSARVWASAGASYFSNLLNWMQSASTLTLVGGLNGLATRLTLWLALLGGAIATSQGKHINVDVVMRFIGPRARIIVAVVGWLAASVVCAAAVWGFIDDIAIGHFLAPQTASPGEKVSHVLHEMGTDLFLLGRQISLDLRSIPHVLVGDKYSDYLHPQAWNDWVRNADWAGHFAPDDVQTLIMDESNASISRLPVISIPGSAENVPGLLVRDFDLILPFGLVVLAVRFLIRSILALTGHVRVDPDAAHGDEDVEAVQAKLHAAGEGT